MKQKTAVFFDRDGILNPDVGFPHRMSDAVLYDDVVPALRRIQDAGYVLVVVSNQSGVARGLFTLSDVRKFNAEMSKKLRRAGVFLPLRNFYTCPHLPADRCECRKPKPGLILRAAKELAIELKGSFCVGDRESDVRAGRAARVFTILLDRVGNHKRTTANLVLPSLIRAAEVICTGKLLS